MQAICKYSICCTAILSILISCSHPKAKIEDSKPDITNIKLDSGVSKDRFEVRTYLNSNSKIPGWGYDIYQDGKLFIHQPNIPSISGERGFKTEEQAKKVGAFVVQKIKNNVIPPTVSIEELDSLKIE